MEIILLAAFLLSLVVAWAASQKGRSPAAWFFISLLVSPIISLLVLIAVGPGRPTARKNAPQGVDLSRLTDDDLAAMQAHRARQNRRETDPLGIANIVVLNPDQTQHAYTLLQLQDAWRAGQLTPEHRYWDPTAEQWLDLIAHPRLT